MVHNFLYPTLTGPAPTVNEIYAKYQQAFEQQVSDGVRYPLVFPYNFFSVFALIAYLCIPHKQNPKIYASRWLLLGLVTWNEFRMIRRSSGVGLGLGIIPGLMSAFVIMLSWTWLAFNRPQWDAKRIQRVWVQGKRGVGKDISGQKITVNGELSQQKLIRGFISVFNTNSCQVQVEDEGTYKYFWQAYPENLKDRISWVQDLVFNTRGPGWNWAISTIPFLTPEIMSKMVDSDKQDFLFSKLLEYVCNFLIVDVLRIAMMSDPYFKVGPNTYDLPSHLQALSPCALKTYRLILTGAIIIAGVKMSFAQNAILISRTLGHKVFGLRAEPCYYPDIWGSFSQIFKNGLAGLWGGYWHQSFRIYFTAPTKYLIQKGYVKRRTYVAKAIELSLAFFISGFLHWAASVTSFPPTNPIDVMVFFVLQSLGIMLQRLLCTNLSSVIIKLPRLIRYAGNLFFVIIWAYFTAGPIADDFARGGMWIVDPVPFSIMRAFGFGEHDASWICWKFINLKWYKGNHWWESGVSLL